MQYQRVITCLLLITILVACGDKKIDEIPYGNWAAEGFNVNGSDPNAIAIADEVIRPDFQTNNNEKRSGVKFEL